MSPGPPDLSSSFLKGIIGVPSIFMSPSKDGFSLGDLPIPTNSFWGLTVAGGLTAGLLPNEDIEAPPPERVSSGYREANKRAQRT